MLTLLRLNLVAANSAAVLHRARAPPRSPSFARAQVPLWLRWPSKTITAGDRLTGRFLHREFFEFGPTHKMLLVTNHKPIIRGQDHAIWRRLALVPSTVKFWKPEENPPHGAPLEDANLAGTLLTEVRAMRWPRHSHDREHAE